MPTEKLLIEVYLENVEAWRKIDVGEMKPLHIEDPIVVMGKDCDREAYKEWQTFQRNWVASLG